MRRLLPVTAVVVPPSSASPPAAASKTSSPPTTAAPSNPPVDHRLGQLPRKRDPRRHLRRRPQKAKGCQGHDQAGHRQPRGVLQGAGERHAQRVPRIQRRPARLPRADRHGVVDGGRRHGSGRGLPPSLEALQAVVGPGQGLDHGHAAFAAAHHLEFIADLKALRARSRSAPPRSSRRGKRGCSAWRSCTASAVKLQAARRVRASHHRRSQ
jgi:hypothetical protein